MPPKTRLPAPTLPWVEERVEAARLALGLAGFPIAADSESLAAWLDGCLTFRAADVPRASLRYRENGSAVVTLPAALSGRELEEARIEECAHYLIGSGQGAELRELSAGDRSCFRTARLHEARDESLARRFKDAWFLPASVLASVTEGGRWIPEDLSEESRCDWPRINARLECLRRGAAGLSAQPAWAAVHQFTLHLRERAPMSLQLVAHGANRPDYQFLVTRRYEETALRLYADLCALTPREFSLKYAADALTVGHPLEIPFTALDPTLRTRST